MSLAIRFVPLPGHSVLYANGRTYPGTGVTVDIPFPDADACSPGSFPVQAVISAANRSPRATSKGKARTIPQ